jgi:hypothetical protein
VGLLAIVTLFMEVKHSGAPFLLLDQHMALGVASLTIGVGISLALAAIGVCFGAVATFLIGPYGGDFTSTSGQS